MKSECCTCSLTMQSVASMMVQYSKFAKMAHETPWRKDVSSLNYIESSTLWRQEHNGFSHVRVLSKL